MIPLFNQLISVSIIKVSQGSTLSTKLNKQKFRHRINIAKWEIGCWIQWIILKITGLLFSVLASLRSSWLPANFIRLLFSVLASLRSSGWLLDYFLSLLMSFVSEFPAFMTLVCTFFLRLQWKLKKSCSMSTKSGLKTCYLMLRWITIVELYSTRDHPCIK